MLHTFADKANYGVGSYLTTDQHYDANDEDDDGNAAVKQIKSSGFKFDDVAKSWVDAAKADITVLDQLEDKNYRAFIEGYL